MATKKERIREADQIVDQNVAPVSAQPATPEEVAQAPVEVPADQVAEPIVDEPVVDEPPVEVNPETIDMEVQIPTDQIAAAVAQATGDVVPAETAPDAVEAKQAEEEPMVAEETVPEGSAEAPVQQPVMESMEDGACGKELEETLDDAVKTVYNDVKAGVKAIGNGIKTVYNDVKDRVDKAMQESKEDEDVLDNIDVPEEEDPADLPDSFAPADGDSDVDDLFSEEPDDDELLDKIEDFVNSDDHSTEDVSDALRTAAAFLDQIADDKKFSFADVVGEPAEEDEIDEGPMTDDKKDLQESKKSPRNRMREAKDFSKSLVIDTNKLFVGDPVELYDDSLFADVNPNGGDFRPVVVKSKNRAFGIVAGFQTMVEIMDDYCYIVSDETDSKYKEYSGLFGIVDASSSSKHIDENSGNIVEIPSGRCQIDVKVSIPDQYYIGNKYFITITDAKDQNVLFSDVIDSDECYDEEDLQESKKSPRNRMREAKRFNKTITVEADKVFVGDPIEVLSEDLFDEVCGDDIPADGILRKDGKVIGLVAVSNNGGGDTTSEHTHYYYWLETGIIGVIDMKYAADGADTDECPRIVDVPSGKCKVTVQYDGEEDVYLEVKDAKTGEKLFWDELDLGYDPDYYDEEDEDYYESRKNRSSKLIESKSINRKPVRLTSRPVVTERHSLKESSGIIYPAGSRPIGRSDEEDLVARQERVHEARRKAIREYRQKVVSQREQSRPANTGRFNEALRDSVRSIKESADPKSWAANTFMDKYEESSKLNYKELLKNGFLG